MIVPIYNTEKYLRRCVDSILSQDYEDFELWLIDDGSKDLCIDIIKDYISTDKRIKSAFIHGTGPAMPRNYGLKRAVGEYVLFVDSDDYLCQGAFRTLMDTAHKFPKATFIKSNQFVLVGDGEKKSVFQHFRREHASKPMSGNDIVINVLRTDFTPTNSLIKRDLLIKNSISFREDLVLLEDVPFIMEICAKSEETVYQSTETYVYRLESETSLTRSKRTLSKVLSLAKISGIEKELSDQFKGLSKTLIRKRSVEHSLTALYQAARNLTKDEIDEVLGEVKKNYRLLPLTSRGIKHKLGAILYNLSPHLAICVYKHV